MKKSITLIKQIYQLTEAFPTPQEYGLAHELEYISAAKLEIMLTQAGETGKMINGPVRSLNKENADLRPPTSDPYLTGAA